MSIKLIRDPEFERFVPPMTSKERELLEESILQEGCRDAIVVWDSIILDGYNRYDICIKHGLPFQIKHMNFDSRDEAISWICINQMARRNITEETRRYLIGKRYEAEKRIGVRNITGRNQYSEKEVSPKFRGKAQRQQLKYGLSGRIGIEYNMAHSTIEKLGRYAQAVDRIAEVEPRVVPHILSGAVQISQDNMIDLGKLTDRQIKAVAASIPYNMDYRLSRDHIISALRRDKMCDTQQEGMEIPDVKVQSVKDMPAYDPDAEVSALTLTIPSWRISIDRVRSSANMQQVSSKAKASLCKELDSLRKTIDDLSRIIREE